MDKNEMMTKNKMKTETDMKTGTEMTTEFDMKTETEMTTETDMNKKAEMSQKNGTPYKKEMEQVSEMNFKNKLYCDGRKKEKQPILMLLGLFCIVQIILIFVYNLFMTRYEVGFDSSAAMAQAMEIWHQKTIFISDWDYQSTLGLDSMIIPAALLYGLTHNIFVAYGIVNCIIVVIYLVVFRDLLTMLGISFRSRLITYIMILTPFSLEPLGYLPMLFTGASYYCIKALIPLLLIIILLKLHNAVSFRKCALPILFLYVSLYMTGFSCGLYLMICGMIPVLLYEIFLVICYDDGKELWNRRILFLLVGCAIYFAGCVTAHFYGAVSYTNGMILCRAEDFISNIGKCITGMAELFGTLPEREITVTSAYGIHYLAHMAALIGYVCVLFYALVKVRPLQVFKNKDHWSDRGFVAGIVVMIMVVNFAVLILTDTTYGSETFEFRYHLIPVISGMFLFGIGLDEVGKKLRSMEKGLLLSCMTLLTVVIMALCNVVYVYYFRQTNQYDCAYEIVQYATNELNVTQTETVLYFAGNEDETIEIARISRLCNHNVRIVDGEVLGFYRGWGASMIYYRELSDLPSTIVVCTSQYFETIDPELQQQMRLLTTIEGYDLYQLYE